MKKVIYHTISLTLACLVLFSTLSFTVDKHFCGDFLVDKALFAEAETCGMHMDATSNNEEDTCCTNQKTQVEGQDHLKISYNSFDFDQQLFLTTFTFTYLNLFESIPSQVVGFVDYAPPFLVTDIHILDQVFLI